MAEAVEKPGTEKLTEHLKGMFGNILDPEIIESVALNCDYDETATTNMLIELVNNVDGFIKPKERSRKTKPENSSPNSPLNSESPKCSATLRESTQRSPIKSRPKSKKEQELERIIHSIQQGYKILILMRGLPGSGKSTLAQQIVYQTLHTENYQMFILSTDDYFTRNGMYVYDMQRLQEAHTWNQQRAYNSMASGISPIIIDNTNTQMWEMKSYASIAVHFGYLIEVLEPFTPWAFNEKELTRRNRHAVNRIKIKEMIGRYEKNITPQKLMAMFNLRYFQNVPQFRSYPPIYLKLNMDSAQITKSIEQKIENQTVDYSLQVSSYRTSWEVTDETDNASNKKDGEFVSPKLVNGEIFDLTSETCDTDIEKVNSKKSEEDWGTIDLTEVSEQGEGILNSKKTEDSWGTIDLIEDSKQAKDIINSEKSEDSWGTIDLTEDSKQAEVITVKSPSKHLQEVWDVDLMDFENEVPNASAWSETNICNQSPNLIDMILSTSDSNEDNILKPLNINTETSDQLHAIVRSSSEPEMKKMKSSPDLKSNDTPMEKEEKFLECKLRNQTEIKKQPNIYPKLDLKSWGLTENAGIVWDSWDTPTFTIEDSKDKKVFSVEVKDSSTNTCSNDFLLATSDKNSNEIKILTPQNRDINNKTPPQSQNSSPPRKFTLDKSSMTEDGLNGIHFDESNVDIRQHMDQLLCLFPRISLDVLQDVYEKCNRDINWVVDLLLDDNPEMLEFVRNSNMPQPETISTSTEEPSSTQPQPKIISDKIEELRNSAEKITLQNNESLNPEPSVSNNDNQDGKNLGISSIFSKGKELLKVLESKFIIGNQHYSEHTLKLKNVNSNTENGINFTQSSSETDSVVKEKAVPSTSKSVEICHSSSGDVIAVDSDKDLDDVEAIASPTNTGEMMELNLGEVLVGQLEEEFGHPDLYPKGFQPVIQVPVDLAKQLFVLYLESVYTQMEAQNQVFERLIKEDEEFARKLQEEEHFKQQHKPPTLKEIMEEEREKNIYRREIEEWRNLTPDDLASKLTRYKLFNAFPTLNQDLLVEILHAHDNSYEQTVEVLLNSTKGEHINDPLGTIREPPISPTTLEEMKTAQKETLEVCLDHEEHKSANSYREEAAKYLAKRQELFQKAQQAFQRGSYEVAVFYSGLASQQLQFYDRANHLAANAFLNEHSRKYHFDTLDLHYLFVKEAVNALDIFIDRNIMLLNEQNRTAQALFIITGRGKRSEGGKSKIKPAVTSRLKRRKLRYCEINPGLLKVKISRSSLTSSDLQLKEH